MVHAQWLYLAALCYIMTLTLRSVLSLFCSFLSDSWPAYDLIPSFTVSLDLPLSFLLFAPVFLLHHLHSGWQSWAVSFNYPLMFPQAMVSSCSIAYKCSEQVICIMTVYTAQLWVGQQ